MRLIILVTYRSIALSVESYYHREFDPHECIQSNPRYSKDG